MMARATQTAPTYAKSSTYDASVETCEREEFATFANVPICHHRGSKVPVGNHVSLVLTILSLIASLFLLRELTASL